MESQNYTPDQEEKDHFKSVISTFYNYKFDSYKGNPF